LKRKRNGRKRGRREEEERGNRAKKRGWNCVSNSVTIMKKISHVFMSFFYFYFLITAEIFLVASLLFLCSFSSFFFQIRWKLWNVFFSSKFCIRSNIFNSKSSLFNYFLMKRTYFLCVRSESLLKWMSPLQTYISFERSIWYAPIILWQLSHS
jgi:hypothetical protein